MPDIWPFLGRHLGLMMAITAITLWGGSIYWYFRRDVRRAWRDYQNRWR